MSLRRTACAVLISLFVLSLLGCRRRTAEIARTTEPPYRFTDITQQCGIDFTYRNGAEAGHFSIAETVGGGVGALDYDRDGRMDLFMIGGGNVTEDLNLEGLPGALFRNLDGQRFLQTPAAAGADRAGRYAHGVAIGDYNGDGFQDILITGYGGLTLLRNQGDGSFVDATEAAGLAGERWSTAAAWGDFNADGLLDLYVVHYLDWSPQNHPVCRQQNDLRDVCAPSRFSAVDDILYLSRGDGTFTDASQASGLKPGGRGLGVVVADFNDSGHPDVYVANDTDDNFLYINDGRGSLTEQGVISGTAHDAVGNADGSMGVSVFDYSGNAMPDIWVTNFENDSFALYRNEGGDRFTHSSGAAGIFAIGSNHVGWGTITDDIDNDGVDEIVVSNGHVFYHPRSGSKAQLPFVLRQQSGFFKLVDFPKDSYFRRPHDGRGLIKVDIDNDGDWDLGFANMNEPFTLLRNDVSNDRPWIGVRLIGVTGNRDAVGAKATLKWDGGSRTRFVAGGGSYLSHSDTRLLWTLPSGTTVADLEVQWPGRQHQHVRFHRFGQYYDIVESSGQ